jgi:RNA polymerase sigma factor (sigma-70 family)
MSSSFQETRWTQVELSQGSSEEARLALSDLCAAYHRPVQAFVRHWCRDQQQAGDLTQEFFARLLARPGLEAERGRGRFRSYLLGAVKHFLSEMQRSSQAQKRGAKLTHEDITLVELADLQTLPPDKLFDQQWACALLDRALLSLASEMQEGGKGLLFERLKPWLSDTAAHGDQLQAANALNISETAVRVQVHRLRKRYRELVEAEVCQTLTPGVSLQEEMHQLFAALTGR